MKQTFILIALFFMALFYGLQLRMIDGLTGFLFLLMAAITFILFMPKIERK